LCVRLGGWGFLWREYVVEALLQGLDPRERVLEYLEAAAWLLEEARRELERGDVRQAAEKVWGAVALAVKAYAYWREGRRLASHRELWEYKDRVAEELGSWVRSVFQRAAALHTCFYEGWCTGRDVEDVYPEARRLVEAVRGRVRGG